MLSVGITQTVAEARDRGMRLRPPIGGFPYLAEALRQAGIASVHCSVVSMTTVYRTPAGLVVDQGTPLVQGLEHIGAFERDAVVAAIRRDQRGDTTYREFMDAIWRAGVVAYDIDLAARTCTYHGIDGGTDAYVEEYAAVDLDD